MKSATTAAPTPKPMPIPSAVTFFFSSRVASSTSSFAIDEACSATCFAAAPTPPFVGSQARALTRPLQAITFASA